MELEDRILQLEAQVSVQAELIRAIVGILPPPHPMYDAPFKVAVRSINELAQRSQSSMQAALEAALRDLNPMQMPRRRQ